MSGWLVAAALILVTTRILGRAAVLVRLPFVVGELAAGVLLGLTATWWPQWHARVLGTASGTIHDISQLAVVLLMVSVGRELRQSGTRQGPVRVAGPLAGSLLFPALVGALLAPALGRPWVPAAAQPAAVVLVMAVVFGVTALPVLALILRELDLLGTPTERTAMSIASIGDLLAWATLAIAMALQRHQDPWLVGGGVLACLAVILLAWRVNAVHGHRLRLPRSWASSRFAVLNLLVCAPLMICAVAAQFGLHPALAALAWALLLPPPEDLEKEVLRGLSATNIYVLVPFFVVEVGLSLGGSAFTHPGLIAVTCLVAFGTKVLGTMAGGRLAGQSYREAAALGCLLSAKGMTEILVLSIARDAQIIGNELFSLGVVVTLIVTAVSAPACQLVSRGMAGTRQSEDRIVQGSA